MKKNFLRITIFILYINLTLCSIAAAQEKYVFIKSKALYQIDEIIKGFTESYPQAQIAMIDMEGNRDTNKIKAFIQAEKPALIICMGSLAAETAIEVEKDIPIIFSMVINYKRYEALNQNNVTGVAMEIPVSNLFTQFRMLMPHIKAIAVPFHPSVSEEIIQEALEAAPKIGIQLIPMNITNPNRIRRNLRRNINEYQGIWMIGDPRLYNQRTSAIQDIIEFSREHKKPVLAFSEAFIRPGAFFSISISYHSLGSQIALMAKQIVHDKTSVSKFKVSPPIGTYTVINKNVAEFILGHDVDEELLEQVDKVFVDNIEER